MSTFPFIPDSRLFAEVSRTQIADYFCVDKENLDPNKLSKVGVEDECGEVRVKQKLEIAYNIMTYSIETLDSCKDPNGVCVFASERMRGKALSDATMPKILHGSFVRLGEMCVFNLSRDELREDQRVELFWHYLRTSLLWLLNECTSLVTEYAKNIFLTRFVYHLMAVKFSQTEDEYRAAVSKELNPGEYNLLEILSWADLRMVKLMHLLVSFRGDAKNSIMCVLTPHYDPYKTEYLELVPMETLDLFWTYRFNEENTHQGLKAKGSVAVSFDFNKTQFRNFNMYVEKGERLKVEEKGPVSLKEDYTSPIEGHWKIQYIKLYGSVGYESNRYWKFGPPHSIDYLIVGPSHHVKQVYYDARDARPVYFKEEVPPLPSGESAGDVFRVGSSGFSDVPLLRDSSSSSGVDSSKRLTRSESAGSLGGLGKRDGPDLNMLRNLPGSIHYDKREREDMEPLWASKKAKLDELFGGEGFKSPGRFDHILELESVHDFFDTQFTPPPASCQSSLTAATSVQQGGSIMNKRGSPDVLEPVGRTGSGDTAPPKLTDSDLVAAVKTLLVDFSDTSCLRVEFLKEEVLREVIPLLRELAKLTCGTNPLAEDDFASGFCGKAALSLNVNEVDILKVATAMFVFDSPEYKDMRTFLHRVASYVADHVEVFSAFAVPTRVRDSMSARDCKFSLSQAVTACRAMCVNFNFDALTAVNGDVFFLRPDDLSNPVQMSMATAFFFFIVIVSRSLEEALAAGEEAFVVFGVNERVLSAVKELCKNVCTIYQSLKNKKKEFSIFDVMLAFDKDVGFKENCKMVTCIPENLMLWFACVNMQLSEDLASKNTCTLYNNKVVLASGTPLFKHARLHKYDFLDFCTSSWTTPYADGQEPFFLQQLIAFNRSPVAVCHNRIEQLSLDVYHVTLNDDATVRAIDLHGAMVNACANLWKGWKSQECFMKLRRLCKTYMKPFGRELTLSPTFAQVGAHPSWYSKDNLVEAMYVSDIVSNTMVVEDGTLLYRESATRVEEMGLRSVYLEDMDECHCKGDCGENCDNRRMQFECHDCFTDSLGRVRESNCSHGSVGCSNRVLSSMTMADMEAGYFLDTVVGKGDCLFAKRAYKKGEIKLPYGGELCDEQMMLERKSILIRRGLPLYLMELVRNKFWIDAKVQGNFTRYIAHSCNPNCVAQRVVMNGKLSVYIENIRDVEVDEELTYSYFPRTSSLRGKEEKGFICHCQADDCVDRGLEVSSDLPSTVSQDVKLSQASLVDSIPSQSSSDSSEVSEAALFLTQQRVSQVSIAHSPRQDLLWKGLVSLSQKPFVFEDPTQIDFFPVPVHLPSHVTARSSDSLRADYKQLWEDMPKLVKARDSERSNAVWDPVNGIMYIAATGEEVKYRVREARVSGVTSVGSGSSSSSSSRRK